ncbi:MAG: hypothetical protein AMXMBFR78_08100 [Rubrivivax sp.]|nr:BrnT family toxin [Rubrivivax sp.]HNU11596.1 BrnT family toxin [Rubrivivax sp.]
MRYSFDPAKQASNRKKHGLDLAEAPKVIESGRTVTFEDRDEQGIYRENIVPSN